MKRYLIGGAIVLALGVGVFAGSHDDSRGTRSKAPARTMLTLFRPTERRVTSSPKNTKRRMPGNSLFYCGASQHPQQ